MIAIIVFQSIMVALMLFFAYMYSGARPYIKPSPALICWYGLAAGTNMHAIFEELLDLYYAGH